MTPGLPDGWTPPRRRAHEHVWAELRERDRARFESLFELSKDPSWEEVSVERDEGEFIMIVLRPVDQTDTREEQVGPYPKAWVEREQRDAEAVADEHSEDQP